MNRIQQLSNKPCCQMFFQNNLFRLQQHHLLKSKQGSMNQALVDLTLSLQYFSQILS